MLIKYGTEDGTKTIKERPGYMVAEMVAAGTRVKTGPKPDDFLAVEGLSAGDFIFDPKLGRYTMIDGMSCGTFDPMTLNDRDMEIRTIEQQGGKLASIVVQRQKTSSLFGKENRQPPKMSEPMVYFRLDFGRQTILDLGPVWISFQPT
jgi:hypothetical protein